LPTNVVAVVVGTLSTVLGTLLVLPLTAARAPEPLKIHVEVVLRQEPPSGCGGNEGELPRPGPPPPEAAS